MAGVEKKGYISCQGESGSCAFGASRVHYFNFTAAPQPSFEEVVRRVVERDAEMGILPIQNTRSGLISEPLTVLARSDLKITAEHQQPIRHHLMVNKAWVEAVAGESMCEALARYVNEEREGVVHNAGQKAEHDQLVRSLLSQVTAVYSDEQGLRQCDRGLKINLAGAERRLTSCTAKASRVIAHETDMAKLNKQEIPGFAAIASEECATMYKNVRLVSDLNDDKANTTRYVAVSREEVKPVQLLADIDVKTMLSDPEKGLSDDDLNLLFPAPTDDEDPWEQIADFEPKEPLARLRFRLRKIRTDFQFGPSSFRSGQERTAKAVLLRNYFAESGKDAVPRLIESFPFGEQRQLTLKLEPLATQVREHILKGKGKEGDATLKQLLASKKYNSRLRSIFIIRAKTGKATQADLLKMLVEKGGKPRKEPIEFSVIAELPRPVDGKDEGFGLVLEADGSLLGASKAFADLEKRKPTSDVGFGWRSGTVTDHEPSDLERVLREIVVSEKATIKVLGTFAKDPRPLGARIAEPAQAETTVKKGRPGRARAADRVADPEMEASSAGAFAALIATLTAAGALAWYSHVFGF